MTPGPTFGRAAIVAAATLAACCVLPAGTAHAATQPAAGLMVAAKSDRGALRVIAQGVPQGRSAKITVSGKAYRKKLPAAGKLRNLRPGRYRVWAAPIVADGGTASVPNLPVTVRVPRSRSTILRLQYQWNPKTDPYPPGPVTSLRSSDVRATSASLSWVNSVAPDLQGVAVRRKQGPVAPIALDDGRAVPVAAATSSVTDTALRQFTTYSYSVFMVDTAGNASAPQSVTVTTSGHAADVVAGTHHTCALLTEPGADAAAVAAAGGGQVACWGANDRGQLGSSVAGRSYSPLLVDMPGATQLAAGGDHSCALLVDATVWCWGRNDHGQLGNGTVQDSSVPVQVLLSAPTKAIAAGGDHTCAVSQNDGLRCWGDNEFGQSGQRPTQKIVTAPPSLPLNSTVGAVAAGWSHTCFVRSGVVRCFGNNAEGQLGNGATDDSWMPVQVSGLTRASVLGAGVAHTCALQTDRSLYCWGANAHGQIGDGSITERRLPVVVSGQYSKVVAGAYHTCAVGDGSQARCWGRNGVGRLGDGTTDDRLTPARVALAVPVLGLAAGGYHSCAVTSADTYCWGANPFGQVGSPVVEPVLRPTVVSAL